MWYNNYCQTNLDNQIGCFHDDMALNTKKIRREIVINGQKTWITADTEQEYAEKVADLSRGYGGVFRKHRFGEYAERWFEVFSKPNIAISTAVTYERQLKNCILPVLGDLYLEDITVTDVQTVFNRMGNTARQTKNKAKMVLNQILKMAVEDRIIPFNPLLSSTLRITGSASIPVEPYSVEEMKYFAANIDRIEQAEDRAWMALSISLPLRPEEVLGLRWVDVDEQSGILRIRGTVTHPTRNLGQFKPYTKTESSRRDLAVTKRLIESLPDRGRPEWFVVSGSYPMSYTQVRRMRTRIARQINYSGVITPRRFRTTVATDISATTHDLKLVQRMLGHSTPQMTLKHYDKGRSTAIDASKAIAECYGL